jgi:hypothetical protein
MVRATLLLWRAGVERIFWYVLKDDPGNPYGLVTAGDGRTDFRTLKPAYYAFQSLSHQLGGATFVEMRDLFSRTVVYDFESLDGWYRGDQPYGSLDRADFAGHSGQAARLRYAFPAGENFVVFLRDTPLPIVGHPYAIGLWVYGDRSGRTLKIWLRDARGRLLQFPIGRIGEPGWQFLSAPLSASVPEWDQITKDGDSQVYFPVSLAGLVLDNAPDGAPGNGVVYLDDLTAISGPEAYDMQLRRGSADLDVLWAPSPMHARLPTAASSATVVAQGGTSRSVMAREALLDLDLGPAPLYVVHRR